MTDEEIEKAIRCCVLCECSECPLVDTIGCQHILGNEKNNYINRLKAECERLKDLSLIVKAHKYCVTPKHCQNQGEIRKETVKEFAKTLISVLWEEEKGESITLKNLHGVIKDIARAQYGVEVDEQ